MARPGYYVTDAKVLDGYRLRLTFEDRTGGTVDLSDLVVRTRVFQPLKDPKFFRQARADADAGTVVWPNEVDVAPEELYARAHRTGRSHDSVLTATGANEGARRRTTANVRELPRTQEIRSVKPPRSRRR